MAFVGCSLLLGWNKKRFPSKTILRVYTLSRYSCSHTRLRSLNVSGCGTRDDVKQAQVADSIKRMAQSVNSDDRAKAVTQCRKLPSQERLEVLLSLAKDESLNVRYSALSQLSSVGAENPRRTLEKIREVLREEKEATLIGAAADVLFSLPLPEVFDELVALYEKTSDWIVRLSIVAGIGELKHPRSFEFLAQALESKDDLVISTAIGALGELGDKRALELLEPLLDSTDATIRDRAYNNIQRLKEA
ncbi:hypothetical protein GAYE_SCF59G6486 [Galdieria yellowstonensis]|uniref:HEAT repeat domain-containing protein n=1 Tax=Galdieria yellowstonensis TaxID=3028027 RepID=A0AAV9IML6_9RHOD|nr:hypothetical protein GAYE_SCF59G6486 [Galdieria yellowstonensis]